LQETYLGKVKMIYIDPPYNTGNDFIYEDDFAEDTEAFLKRSNQKSEAGARLTTNTESNGRFHSDWLSMMYPRLKLARNLLRDDGVIFISIDDSENANLKRMCDEVFGEGNFVATLIWERAFSPKNDAKFISNNHDYVFIYTKLIQKFVIGRLQRTEEADARYCNPDNDPRGVWMSSDMSVKTYNAECDYPITTPSGRVIETPTTRCWSLSKNSFLERLQDNRIWFGADGNGVPRIKRFLTELKFEGMAPTSILFHKDVGHSQEGAKEVVALFDGEGGFDGPKPRRLLDRLITLANTDADSIILDFFSGSATTAHAVMQLNVEDGGNRKFIMVQIPEICDKKSEANKAGYKTIAEIGKERIRRAGKKITQDNASKPSIDKLDIGFRVLKIGTSNMADVYYAPDTLDKDTLDLFIDNIKPDCTSEDLLFQVMLDWGVDLALPITRQTIQDKEVFFVDNNALAACFDAHGGIDEAFVKELAKHQALRVVFRDTGYKDSAVKINVEQIFKLLSPTTEIKCI